MFFRLKKSGERGYVQIVENKRDEAAVRQRVIANVGRADDSRLRRAQPLSSLRGQAHRSSVAHPTRSTRTELLSITASESVRPMLFGRIWERLGVADVLTHLLKERAFEFRSSAPCSSPRCIGYSSRDRIATVGRGWRITTSPAAEGLDLHHFYRAMAWLGREEVEEEAGKGAVAALRQGPDRGEAVRPPPRSIHRPLHRIHGHHQPLLLRRGRRDARRARLLQGLSPRPEADDPRPRRRRRRAADLHRDVAGKHRRRDVTLAGGRPLAETLFHRPGLRRRRPRHDLGRNHRQDWRSASSNISSAHASAQTPSCARSCSRTTILSCPSSSSARRERRNCSSSR